MPPKTTGTNSGVAVFTTRKGHFQSPLWGVLVLHSHVLANVGMHPKKETTSWMVCRGHSLPIAPTSFLPMSGVPFFSIGALFLNAARCFPWGYGGSLQQTWIPGTNGWKLPLGGNSIPFKEPASWMVLLGVVPFLIPIGVLFG